MPPDSPSKPPCERPSKRPSKRPCKSRCGSGRRIAPAIIAGALLAALAAPLPVMAQASQQLGQPPHAWLFGAWAGGILPAPPDMSAAECDARASFVVTKDAVIHSTLTHPTAIENLIASVRGTPDGTIFALAPTATKPDPIAGIPDDLGFGCPQPDILRVVRVGPNEISFPNCAGFPSPLVRCPPPGR
jgi:hypothetical protein